MGKREKKNNSSYDLPLIKIGINFVQDDKKRKMKKGEAKVGIGTKKKKGRGRGRRREILL